MARHSLLLHTVLAALALARSEHTQASDISRRGTVVFTDTFDNIAGWDRQGVVLATSQSWESSLMQDPSILVNQGIGAKFKMFYGSLTGVGYATSDDGMNWKKKPDPLLTETLDIEKGALNQPSVVLKDGTWHMTYFGVDGSGVGRILYANATSPDGPWSKGGAVIVPTADWEDNYIYNSALLYDTDAKIWKVWYTAGKIASAGGEPEFICYATAPAAFGPWTKHPSNPLLKPMNDGGWLHLGVGGPNIRKLNSTSYELVVLGWQADWPSRAGRIFSTDGIKWSVDRSALMHDLGVAGGVEDQMIYRPYIVDVDGNPWLYYNTKNHQPQAWIETINLAKWSSSLSIIDPSKWAMIQGTNAPSGASFEVRSGRAFSLGNTGNDSIPQGLQGNRIINSKNYAFSLDVTPMDYPVDHRDNVIFVRYTDRSNYYYGGIASWNNKYAIGKLVNGQNTKIAGTGASSDIYAGNTYHLRLEISGTTLTLYDNNVAVVTVSDSDLQPASSYVGVQTTKGTGHATFDNAKVELL